MSMFTLSAFKKKIDTIKVESDSTVVSELDFEPANEFGVKLLKGITLKPYQIEVVKWLLHRENNPVADVRGAINASEMGTGKTIEALTVVMSDYSKTVQPDYPTLIVCTVSSIYTWKSEIEKFFGNSCSYLIVKPDIIGKKQLDNLSIDEIKKYKIIIVNYETIRIAAKKYNTYSGMFETDSFGRTIGINGVDINSNNDYDLNEYSGTHLLMKIPWNRIIFDESHAYNNPRSEIFYSVMCLYAQKKMALTGTPCRNYNSDLYAQFRVLGFNKIVIPKQFTFDLYKEHKLSELILYMTKEDAGIELPEINTIKVVLKLNQKEREIYDFFYKEIKKAHNAYSTKQLSFTNVLTLFTRLRQFCSAPYTILSNSNGYIDGDNSDEDTNDKSTNISNNTTYISVRDPNEEIEDLKQERLHQITKGIADWLQDIDGQSGKKFIKISAAMNIITKKIPKDDKIIIYTSFKKFIRLFEQVLEDYPDIKYQVIDGDIIGEDRIKILNKFKSDQSQKILIMTYKVGSESLNLTEANHIILMDSVWCQAVVEQAICRAHRLGQQKSVTVWQLSIENTIEDRMLELCKNKKEMFQDFITNKKDNIQLSEQIINAIIR